MKGCLFDLDGTLTDTLRDIADAMNRCLTANGLPTFAVDEYRYLVGDGAKKLAERAVRDRSELAETVWHAYQRDYEQHSMVTTHPYDGITELLRALTDRGVRIGVFSNKPDADTRRVVAHYFPNIEFSSVRGQLADIPLKPDPTGALLSARAMGIDPAEMLYLGDTSVDMLCAKAAGMTPIGVLWGFRKADELLEAGASALIAHPSELLEHLGDSPCAK